MSLLMDLRHGVRVLRRRPLLTAVAAGSLALGIGVGTALFSVADALVLRPLAVADPGRLVEVLTRSPSGFLESLSWPEARELPTHAPSLASVAAYDRRGILLRRGDELELLLLSAVSDGYFATLGVRAALGRVIEPGIDRGLPAPAVVISDRLWRARFGADSSLVGRAVRLSDRPFTVIGVLPPGFRGLERGPVNDVWISLDAWSGFYGSPASLEMRGGRHFEVVARLAPGATLARAASELDLLGSRWATAFPEASRGRTLLAFPATRIAGGPNPLALLLGAGVLLVLAIAGANASTLLVGLGDARRAEIGMRQALGASRPRIVRQVLAESALLALAGAGAGLALAQALVRAAPALLPPVPVALDFDVRLDGRAVGVAGLLALLATVAGGVVPALRASRVAIAPSLRVTAGSATPRRLLALPTALVALQVALAVVALNTAGLLLGSFLATRSAPRGFDTGRSILVLDLSMGDETGDLGRFTTSLESLRGRALGLPGVRNATYVRRLPMAGSGGGATLPVSAPGGSGSARDVRYDQVGPGYAETLGPRLRAGRFFAPAEHAGRSPVVVVSEAFATFFFGATPAVGRHVLVGGEDHEVIGVVDDAPIERIHEEPEPFLYLTYARRPSSDVTLLVETSGEPGTLAPAARALVREVSPRVKVTATTTLARHMAESWHEDWVLAVVGSSLSALGVLLALAGLYGAVALLAGRRAREFGIRLSLGARPADVLGLVLRHGLALAVAGVAAGIPGALVAGSLVRGFLYGVSPLDPRVLVTSAAGAVLMGLLASVTPALRALRTDPAGVLRLE
ncbi:MAG TPA: ADOP family duplicated permease [Vicinamibacteria bacterium]|nr:ADOP family duplicated permease [Vicinamibacteria bacterium]